MDHHGWADKQEYGRLVVNHTYCNTDAVFGIGRGIGLRSSPNEDIIDFLVNFSQAWEPETRVSDHFVIFNLLF